MMQGAKGNIVRVFPRRTSATPDDPLAFSGPPPKGGVGEVDEIHISVAFTYDMEKAERLAEQWSSTGLLVRLGGPAFNTPGGEFVPGRYLKYGYVITSRGCPNRCWFCAVPKREGGQLRELPVTDGWIVSDDNLLACSPRHIDEVFSMLARQPHRPIFTGGLEAALMTSQMAAQLYQLHPQRLFFAYDTPNDLEPLQEAGKMLTDAGFSKSNHALRCYILIGYKGDTMEKAHKRMGEAWRAGFMPFAMLYRDNSGQFDPAWKWFQGQWANPRITYCNCKRDFGD